MHKLQSTHKWCIRHEAEKSTDWIQPIPCVLIKDFSGRYCAFRRIRKTRDDLRGKVSLVVGGHVDRPDRNMPFLELLSLTLSREIKEEIEIERVPQMHPLGLVIDNSSIRSSRHVGFLYELSVTHTIVTTAPEEFSTYSKISGQFFSDMELGRFHAQMDPWSKLILEDFIRPSGTRASPRQQGLAIDI